MTWADRIEQAVTTLVAMLVAFMILAGTAWLWPEEPESDVCAEVQAALEEINASVGDHLTRGQMEGSTALWNYGLGAQYAANTIRFHVSCEDLT